MFYLYILYSEPFDRYYIGYSSRPFERLEEHNTQDHFNTFTKKYRPWKMRALFQVSEKETAIRTERFLKRQKSRRLLEMLCDSNFVPEGKLSVLLRVPHVED